MKTLLSKLIGQFVIFFFSKSYIVSGTLILLIALMCEGEINAQNTSDGISTILHAQKAKVTGNLKILGNADASAIHFWNNLNDTISWVWTVDQPGNYHVQMNYSLDKVWTGGKMLFVADNQQIIAPAEPTTGWADYRIFELGVVNIGKAGSITVLLKAMKLTEPKGGPLPDIAWLSLTPTNAPATSKPLDAISAH
jgi:hypothetical protein